METTAINDSAMGIAENKPDVPAPSQFANAYANGFWKIQRS